MKPLDVQVVALDWKWLFIYPEYGIASVNELYAPVDRPIHFSITSQSVMNSFYIPALAGQIYAMPGMETQLNAVVNRPGDYAGFSANISGSGFSEMRFRFHGASQPAFDQWIERVRTEGSALDHANYIKLEQKSVAAPIMHFSSVAPDLFDAVLNRCVESDQACIRDMMRNDAKHDMSAMPDANNKAADDNGGSVASDSSTPNICVSLPQTGNVSRSQRVTDAKPRTSANKL